MIIKGGADSTDLKNDFLFGEFLPELNRSLHFLSGCKFITKLCLLLNYVLLLPKNVTVIINDK